MAEAIRKGDFVWFNDDTKERYPGKVTDIEKEKYIVEICANKKNCTGEELETVMAKREQLELRLLGL